MKVAVVTGASSGIGKEVAIQLASKGYFVYLTGRNGKALGEVEKAILNTGGKAEAIKLDLLSIDSIKAVATYLQEKNEKLSLLANIAGLYHDDKKHFFDIPFEKYPDEAIVQNINTSLVGHILLTKYLVPLMEKGASVINMSGTFGTDETGAISDFIAKKGNELFSVQLALEVKDKGIRSNCIRPGFVFTENVQKYFPTLTKDEALNPTTVATKIILVAEDSSLNGEIIELTV